MNPWVVARMDVLTHVGLRVKENVVVHAMVFVGILVTMIVLAPARIHAEGIASNLNQVSLFAEQGVLTRTWGHLKTRLKQC